MTATVETVSEQLDLAAIMPSEKVVTAVARSVTLSDADVGKFWIIFVALASSNWVLICSNCNGSSGQAEPSWTR